MNLPSGWYVVARSCDIPRRKPVALRRFGRDWAFWRDGQGRVAGLPDACPHRSARLSLGRVVENDIECPFHGLRFAPSGECTWVPELKRQASGMGAACVRLQEAHGFVWMWWNSAGLHTEPHAEPSTGDLNWFPDIDASYRASGFRKIWPQHFSRCVENQLDWAHLFIVHKSTIGRFADPAATPELEVDSAKIRFRFPGPRTKASFIEYRFPNIWQNRITPKFTLSLAFVPVDDETTELILQSHRRFLRIPGLGWVVDVLMNGFNRWILGQDHRVVIGQRPKDTSTAGREKLLASDRAIVAFREWCKRT